MKRAKTFHSTKKLTPSQRTPFGVRRFLMNADRIDYLDSKRGQRECHVMSVFEDKKSKQFLPSVCLPVQ